MKKLFTSIFILISVACFAQNDNSLNGLFNKAGNVLKSRKSATTGLSTTDIANGLKDALALGAEKSTSRLSATDGFFKDAAVKILMPPEVAKVQSKLQMLGLSSLVDNAVLSMNRAAEDASKSAAPIFLQAIKSMSITDALSILRGSDTSATSYLRHSTLTQLSASFAPIIQASLKKVDATKYWTDVFTAYNRFSFNKVDTDINSYVANKALNGMFYYVVQEEQKIRKDPAARVTDILKKVFGNQ